MVKSLYSGVSGLKTHQQRMDVIGNNIANVNTVGNKADVVTFSDVYYQTKRSPSAATSTLGGVNPRQVGYGVKMNTTTANMTQSGYTQSDNKFDMAINGNGFFQVMDGSGNIFYTRAGIFNIDDAGYLVNADGYHVLGVTGDSQGQEAGSEIIRAVIPATDAKASSATKRINGTDVTLSVSAPSDYTNMTVAFQDAEFPYATYANDILTIFFNPNRQYNSQEEFEQAINDALQAGGITLPDDVSLKFDFAEIPSDADAQIAENSISGLIFSTPNATAELQYKYKKSSGNGYDYAYMRFTVDDNVSKDKVTIKYDAGINGNPTASYRNGEWILTLDEDTEMTDLQKAINAVLADNPTVAELKVSFVCPDKTKRAEVLQAFDGTTSTVEGARDAALGSLGLVVHDAGEFANNYKVTFAYTQGYDKTKAVWDGNNLTVTVCANSSIADVNKAILEAANGNTKKMLTFTDISGLGDNPTFDYQQVGDTATYTITQTDIYGTTRTGTWTSTTPVAKTPTEAEVRDFITATPPTTTPAVDFSGAYTIDSIAAPTTPGSTDYTITVSDGTNTATFTMSSSTFAPPTEADVAGATGWTYVSADGKAVDESQFFLGDPATPSGPYNAVGKDENVAGTVWNPGMREAFFGGNPAISPAGGKDSFFTGVAKGLSTFALEDGRKGEEQSFKDFTDITVQQDGRIIGLHSVHGYIEIGRIDIAQFDNPNGLAKVGGTNFQETVASGKVKLSVAGQGGAGVVLSGALEMSNVDLADEFTNMITTQRGYQANSRVITVSDTMLEELLSLKR
ncbi:MAG: flagellar hook-basal body complex protein [Oscillospiraceae bacterium]